MVFLRLRASHEATIESPVEERQREPKKDLGNFFMIVRAWQAPLMYVTALHRSHACCKVHTFQSVHPNFY